MIAPGSFASPRGAGASRRRGRRLTGGSVGPDVPLHGGRDRRLIRPSRTPLRSILRARGSPHGPAQSGRRSPLLSGTNVGRPRPLSDLVWGVRSGAFRIDGLNRRFGRDGRHGRSRLQHRRLTPSSSLCVARIRDRRSDRRRTWHRCL